MGQHQILEILRKVWYFANGDRDSLNTGNANCPETKTRSHPNENVWKKNTRQICRKSTVKVMLTVVRLFHSRIVHREHVPLDLHVAIVYHLERFIVDFAMTHSNDPAFSLFSNSANTACLWNIHFINLWSFA